MQILFYLFMLLGKWIDPEPVPDRPNVLFIAVDDLRPDLGCYGNLRVLSPNIDALAAEGILFEHAYCQQATCAPSRTSLLTGLHPDETGVTNHVTHFRTLHPDITTLPQLFTTAGYATCGVGKIFHFAEGYQDPVSWSEPAQFETTSKVKTYIQPGNQTKGKGVSYEITEAPDTAYTDGKIAAEVIEKLHIYQKEGKSFFLAAGFLKPHLPYTMPRKYWDRYRTSDFSLEEKDRLRPQGAPDVAFHHWQELRGYTDVPNQGPVRTMLLDSLRRAYYACITFVDAQIGKILDELKASGLDKNTIVVLWGDHGYHLGEQDLWHKHANFELDTHVPLIFKVPGMSAKRISNVVELLDIYPTLSELASLEPANPVSGISLVGQMKNSTDQHSRFAFSQYFRPYGAISGKVKPTHMGYTVRSGEFRYTGWFRINADEPEFEELYDLTNEAFERKNVSNEKALESIHLDLKKRVINYKNMRYELAYAD